MSFFLSSKLNSVMAVTAVGLLFSGCASQAPALAPCPSKTAVDQATESTFEQDRKAILAMSGDYTVKFQFMETAALRAGYELTKPYLADATEIIEVIEDTGTKIDMQHILLVPEGNRVVKHWRQTWIYEPTEIYEFKGNRTWEPRKLSEAERKGAWSQFVYQVDDSPRYGGVGRWNHAHNMSSWESRTWRPLPRREYTKRSDYDVMVARNRHTITPTGWIHEQDNYKLVLGGGENPIIALEVGLNVYDRTTAVDFSKVRQYWKDTKAYWGDVRASWAPWMDGTKTVRMNATWEDKPMYKHMFGMAKEVLDKPDEAEARKARVRDVIAAFMAKEAEAAPKKEEAEEDSDY